MLMTRLIRCFLSTFFITRFQLFIVMPTWYYYGAGDHCFHHNARRYSCALAAEKGVRKKKKKTLALINIVQRKQQYISLNVATGRAKKE